MDQEAEEDEVLQAGLPSLRLASQEANKELVTKAERYRAILKQASDSDKVVRDKWDEWETNITELTWSEVCARKLSCAHFRFADHRVFSRIWRRLYRHLLSR